MPCDESDIIGLTIAMKLGHAADSPDIFPSVPFFDGERPVRAASQYDRRLAWSAIVGSKTNRHLAQPFDVSDPRDIFSIIAKGPRSSSRRLSREKGVTARMSYM